MTEAQRILLALINDEVVEDYELQELGEVLAKSPSTRENLKVLVSLERGIQKYIGDIEVPVGVRTGIMDRIKEHEDDSGHGADWTRSSDWVGALVGVVIVVAALFGWATGINGSRQSRALLRSGDSRVTVKSDSETVDISNANANVSEVYDGNRPGVNRGMVDRAVEVVSPNGGEVYVAGSVVPIFGVNVDMASADIEYSQDGGMNWGPLYDVSAYDGHLLWKLSNNMTQTSDALLRIIEEDSKVIEPRLIRTLYAHDSGAAISEFALNGEYILSVGADAEMYLLDVRSGKIVTTMEGHTNHITYAKVSHNGEYVASCSQDGSVQVWNLRSGEQLNFFVAADPKRGVPWSVAWDPGDTIIAVGNDDGSITFWDLRTGSALRSIGGKGSDKEGKYHTEAVRFIEYTNDGSKILSASSDTRALIMDVKSGTVQTVFRHHEYVELGENANLEEVRRAGRRKVVNGVQLAQDGRMAITCGYDGDVKYWDVQTGKMLRSRVYHSGMQVSSVTLSHDEKWLISTGYDGTAKVIDVKSGSVVAVVSLGAMDPSLIARSSFSRDDRYIAVAQWSGRVTLWRLHKVESVDESDRRWSVVPCG